MPLGNVIKTLDRFGLTAASIHKRGSLRDVTGCETSAVNWGWNFGAMETETAREPEKLVGKYFHSGNENNKIECQGVVIGEPHSGWYLVQLFEWASGEPTEQRLVPIEKMIGWLFYPDVDAMKFSSRRF
jgi:hypothetical protein